MSNIVLPPDGERAKVYESSEAIILKYMHGDGSVTAPDNMAFGEEVLPPSSGRAAAYNRAPASLVKYMFPNGSVHDGLGLYDALGEAFYNSVDVIDVTLRAAPTGSARGHNWFVLMLGPLQGSYYYKRPLYDTSFVTPSTNPVAWWIIDKKHIFFEFLNSDGSLNHAVDITDVNGNPLIDRFQPIQMGGLWFFGENIGTDPFPTDDTVRSMLYFNASMAYQLMGDTRDLITTETIIVPAINEIVAMIRSRPNITVQQGLITPDDAIGNLGDIFISGNGMYSKMLTTLGDGLLLSGAAGSGTIYNGLWTDMGIDTEGTANGNSQGAHWYLHESSLYVLKWSLYSGGSGYYWINTIINRKADDGNASAYASAPFPITPQTLPPGTFTLNMGAGTFNGTWVWQTGSGDPVETWVKIY